MKLRTVIHIEVEHDLDDANVGPNPPTPLGEQMRRVEELRGYWAESLNAEFHQNGKRLGGDVGRWPQQVAITYTTILK